MKTESRLSAELGTSLKIFLFYPYEICIIYFTVYVIAKVIDNIMYLAFYTRWEIVQQPNRF